MDLGAMGFWIFLTAVVVASIWKKKHVEAMRHETVRLMIEKNQRVDDSQLAKILNPDPPKPPEWMGLQSKPGRPGDAYRALRIIGTLLLFVALGLLIVAVWRGMILGMAEESVLGIATGIPIIAMLGAGFFAASRYVALPPDENRGK